MRVALTWTLAALGRGLDVYLFLIGMMVLAEIARRGRLFDWAAGRAVALAGTSRFRLFALVYVAGVITTALLSNDATIVVLTPAVIDALRRVDAPPLAYVMACALVANAASFTLPIANPANLLVFARRMPGLGAWLATFALPSLAALLVTFAVLAWWFRAEFRDPLPQRERAPDAPPQRASVIVLAVAAAVIVITSGLEGPLGTVTFCCAVVGALIALFRRATLLDVLRSISWSVIALTAALFVVVAAIDAHGGITATNAVLTWCAALPQPWGNVAIGAAVALASNLINNLPVGLQLGQTLPAFHGAATVTNAALIGVNLGPNATVIGSLATLLWLSILRRAKIDVSPLRFAAIGTLTMVPALVSALLLVR